MTLSEQDKNVVGALRSLQREITPPFKIVMPFALILAGMLTITADIIKKTMPPIEAYVMLALGLPLFIYGIKKYKKTKIKITKLKNELGLD